MARAQHDGMTGQKHQALAKGRWSRALTGALSIALLAATACSATEEPESASGTASALSSQDVLGFEAVSTWTASSGTAASTTTRTQGAAAFALTAPVNFTTLVSNAVSSTAANLVGISGAGLVVAVDMLLPTLQPTPTTYLGALQIYINAPSRGVFNQFFGDIELTGRPLNTFQTYRFTVTDFVRNALRGATFNDLTFTVALNAPAGARGTYIFDNVRVLGPTTADFSLAASPATVTVAQGGSATSTVTITRLNGFAAGVAFTASDLPTGVTAAFNPATTTTTGTTAVVTFTAAASATLGSATVTITGAGGGLARSTTIGLTVNPPPTFTLSSSPAAVTVQPGMSAPSTITIARSNGFASAVAFSASGLPAGVTAAFNPAATTATGTTSVVTFTAAATAPPATATVTITGTGGGLTRTTSIALTVTLAPDFMLAAAPTSVSVVDGASAQTTVTVMPLNGFAAAVAFSATGLPTGVTATFNPATTTPGGTTSVVTFAAAATAPTGTATVTIAGTGGGLTRTVTVSLTVTPAPDFSLVAAPAMVTVVQGSSATSTMTVTPLNGFGAAVAFSATDLPAGVTATFNPAATTPPGTTSVVTFTAAATAATGTTSVTITATSGALARTATIALTVSGSASTFPLTIFATPLLAPQVFDGVVATVTDPNPAATTASLVATINWGDATPDTIGVIGVPLGAPPGLFSVSGSHVYINGIVSSNISVTITDLVTGATASTTLPISLAPQLTAFALPLLAPQVFDGVVATFIDNASVTPFPPDSTATFTATINWGDATPNTVGVIGVPLGAPPRTFSVSGSHVYINGIVSSNISVTITDLITGATASTTLPISLAPQLTAFTLPLLAPQVFDGVVATFTDNASVTPFPPDSTATFTATINWGDATPDTIGAIGVPLGAPPRTFSVSGSHVYINGIVSSNISVTITDLVTGAFTSTTLPISLAPQATAFTQPIASPSSFDGVVATFTDNASVTPSPPDSPATFTATINWGDATPDTVGVIGVPLGAPPRTFSVSGSHVYLNGIVSSNISVTITDLVTGAVASTTSPISIGSP